MTRRRRIAGFVLLTAVAIGLVCYVTRPREPVYQGRPLSAWLADLNAYDPRHEETWNKAFEAVRQIGTNALPQIRGMLRAEDSAAKKRLNDLLRKQSVTEFRFKTAKGDYDFALSACEILGPIAKEALPDLRRHVFAILRDDDHRLSVQLALAAIGRDAVPLLVEALTNKIGSVRHVGAGGLYAMGTNARSAVPHLIASLKDTDLETRHAAAMALANLDQEPEIWMPVLIELVHHKESGVWRSTIPRLAEFGSKAKAAVPTLLTALEDEDSEIRKAAAHALKKIDPEAAAKAGVK